MQSNGMIREGWIEVVVGCMFSGKSDESGKRIEREKRSKFRNVLNFVPIEARREVELSNGEKVDTTEKVVSRSGKIFQAVEFERKKPEQILDYVKKHLAQGLKLTTVAIEEAHFCEPTLLDVVRTLAEVYKLRVIVVGLDQDFAGNGFGPIPSIMAEAEFVKKELAVCTMCGSQNASKSWLDPEAQKDAKGNILVGSDPYAAVCRHCHRDLRERYGMNEKK